MLERQNPYASLYKELRCIYIRPTFASFCIYKSETGLAQTVPRKVTKIIMLCENIFYNHNYLLKIAFKVKKYVWLIKKIYYFFRNRFVYDWIRKWADRKDFVESMTKWISLKVTIQPLAFEKKGHSNELREIL